MSSVNQDEVKRIRKENFQSSLSKNPFKERVLQLLFKKIMDPNLTLPQATQEDRLVSAQVNRMITQSKEKHGQPISYQQIEEDFLKSPRCLDTMVISFPMESSGSSGQQFDPIYIPDDELVPMLKSDAIRVEDYFVAKIHRQSISRLLVEFGNKKKIKQDIETTINILRTFGDYLICQTSRSSHLSRSKIRFYFEEDQGKSFSKDIKFSSSKFQKQSNIILKTNLGYDFSKKQPIDINILEEIIILSLDDKLNQEDLMQVAKLHKKELLGIKQIDVNLGAIVSKQKDKIVFLKIMSELLDKTPISQAQLLYQLLCNGCIQNFNLNDAYLSHQIIKLLIYSCVHSETKKELLTQSTIIELYQIIQRQCIKHHHEGIILEMLVDLYEKNCVLYREKYRGNILQFKEQIINNVFYTQETRLVGIIVGFAYLIDVKKSSPRLEHRFLEILKVDDVAGANQKSHIFHKYSNILLKIVCHSDFTIEKFRVKEFYEYLLVFCELVSLQGFRQVLNNEEHVAKIKKFYEYFLKKTENILQKESILILREVLTNDKLKFLIKKSKTDELFEKFKKYHAVRNFWDRIDLISEFNKSLILPAIENDFMGDELQDKYHAALKDKKKVAFEILGTGLNENFLSHMKNQEKYSKLLNKFIASHFKNENQTTVFKNQWHMGFSLHAFINEKILEKVLSYLSFLQQRTKQKQFSKIESIINKEAKDTEKQNLKIILLMGNMRANEEEILKCLKNEKIYLKILASIIGKKQHPHHQQFRSVIQVISVKIIEGGYKYPDLKSLKPDSDRDIERFKNLFNTQTYKALIKHIDQISDLQNHLGHLQKYLKTLIDKYRCDQQSCEEKLTEISEEVKKLNYENVRDAKKFNTFPEFPKLLIYLYHFEWFYINQDLSDLNLKRVLEKSSNILKEVKEDFKNFFNKLDQDIFSLKQYNEFEFDRLSQQELAQILTQYCQTSEKPMEYFQNKLQFSKRIVDLASFYGYICKNISALVVEDGERELFVRIQENYKNILSKEMDIMLQNVMTDEKQLLKILEDDFGLAGIEYDNKKAAILKTVEKKQGKIEVYQIQEQFLTIVSLVLVAENAQVLVKLGDLQKKFRDMKQFLQEYYDEKLVLNTEDIENCSEVVRFYKNQIHGQVKTLKNLKKIMISFKSKPKQFVEVLNDVLMKTEDFHTCSSLMENIHHIQNTSIRSILDNSELFVSIKAKNHQLTVVFLTKNPKRQITMNQLEKCKDQALVNLAKYKREKSKEKSEDIDIKNITKVFLQLYNLIGQITQVHKQLLSYGYFVENDLEETQLISKNNLEGIKSYLKQKNELKNYWIDEVKKLYDYSEKATMLRGIQLKEFYNFLKNNNREYPQKFRYIANVKFLKQVQISTNIKGKFKSLELLKEFFNLLNKQNDSIKKAQDQDTYFMDLINFNEKVFDYTHAIGLIDKDKIERLEEDSVLYCTEDTQDEDVSSFIERATRNSNKQFILMGYEKLPISLQDMIINMIKQKKDKQNNYKAKLCLVSNSTTQKLYRYALTNTIKRNMSTKDVEKKDKIEYKNFLKKRLQQSAQYGKVRIYQSVYPGLGKTYQIEKQVKRAGREIIYFPISGRTTREGLFERVSRIQKEGKNKIAFLLQLYNIENEDIINDFLMQLVLWRSYTYRSQYCCFEQTTPIYIELQEPYEEYEEIVTFLKLKDDFPQIFCKIKQFDMSKLDFQNTAQNNYVIAHLLTHDKKQLDQIDLPNYYDFEAGFAPGKLIPEAKMIIEKYFIQKSKAFTKDLTFYQYRYWMKLIFDSCCAFSQSLFLQRGEIKNMKAGMQGFADKLRMNQLRSTFFEELLKNSIQFLFYSNIDEGGQFSGRLKSLPFIIIPYPNKDWFSFIYKNVEQIPTVIKLFLVSQHNSFIKNPRNYTTEQSMKPLFNDFSLDYLEKNDKAKFQSEINRILSEISGNPCFDMNKHPEYTINIDNFMKMCLIAYRMRANISLVIQGEAGVGKTALLRFLLTNVFRYEFKPHVINAGVTEQKISKILKETEETCRVMGEQKRNKKVCLFLDEFNTLPEIGYIKQLILQKRFMGIKKGQNQNLITFGACNPYRRLNNSHQNGEQRIAFKVRKLPKSIWQILWDFSSLKEYEMKKYIQKMLLQIEIDRPHFKYVQIVSEIQNQLNRNDFGCVSLRDIERMRLLYHWFKMNLPVQKSNIPLPPNYKDQHYKNIHFRAFVMALSLNYLVKFNTNIKRTKILSIIDKVIRKQEFLMLKKFEEEDLCNRLNVNYEGIAINESLRQNIYCCFVATMNRIPLIIVGEPGCSKSLSARILRDNFSGKDSKETNRDTWINSFSKITQFSFQGSEKCLSSSITKLFQRVQEFNEKKKKMNIVPLILFDEIGLAEKSPDNPLKVLHQPLEISYSETDRKMAFIGISNDQLDISKMSRFMIVKRPEPHSEDLSETAMAITKDLFKKQKISPSFIEQEIKQLAQTYSKFINKWKQSRNMKGYFGLRDFYSMIKEFASQLLKNQATNNDQKKIKDAVNIAVFRNFNGFQEDYRYFLQLYYGKQQQIKFNILSELIITLKQSSRRYPLIIVPSHITLSILTGIIRSKFEENNQTIIGSVFQDDKTNEKYIIKSLWDFVKIVERETILIANNLNQTVETTLYDFFNKFYTKRAGNDIFRVALQSGLLFPGKVHHKFNCCIMIEQSKYSSIQPAFLNRFQKYALNSKDLENEDTIILSKKISSFIQKIKQICKQNQLGHYGIQHLFLNCSEISLKSLIWQSLIKNHGSPIQNHERYCIEKIVMLSTNDFEYIFKKIILPKNLLGQYADLISQVLEQKQEKMNQEDVAVLLTTDSSLWRKQDPKTSIIKLELYKSQEQLETQIYKFLEDFDKNIAEIDFMRTQGGNMCDEMDNRPKYDPNSPESMLSVEYVVELVQKCKNRKLLESRIFKNKKIRIIIEFNRKISQSIPDFSFLSYPIYTKQGRNFDSDNTKKNIFQNFNLRKFIENVLKQFEWDFTSDSQVEKCQGVFMDHFVTKMVKDQSFFSEICKNVIGTLQGQNFEISEEDIISALHEKSNLRNYKNIETALAIGYFLKKLNFPIYLFIEIMAKENMLLNTQLNSLGRFMDKIYNIEHLKCKSLEEYIPEEQEGFKKFFKELVQKYFKDYKMGPEFRKKKNSSDQLKQIKHIVTRPTIFPLSSKIFKFVFESKDLIKFTNQWAQANQKRQQAMQSFKNSFNEIIKRVYKQSSLNSFKLLNKHWKRMFLLDFVVYFMEISNLCINNAFYILEFYDKIAQNGSLQFKIAIILYAPDFWANIFKIYNVLADNGIFLSIVREFDENSIQDYFNTFSQDFLKQIERKLPFDEKGFHSIRVPKKEKQQTFLNIYSRVVQQISYISNTGKIQAFQKVKISFMLFINDFISFWLSYSQKNQEASLDDLLTSLKSSESSHKKIKKIFYFLRKIKQTSNKHSANLIVEFFGNKLFYYWIKYLKKEERLEAIQNLVSQSQDAHFTHNIVGCIMFLFDDLGIDYSNSLQQNTKKIQQCTDPDLGSLNEKIILNSNLSVLIVNIFYREISRSKWVQANKNSLEKYYKDFDYAIRHLNPSKQNLKYLFLLAFCKFYLQCYINTPCQQKYEIFSKIDKILCQKSIKVTNQMRIYCLKLLRKKMRTKQIYQNYIQNIQYNWCQEFQGDLIEKKSREISIPKDPENISNKLLDAIRLYIDSEGSNLEALDEIFKAVDNQPQNRYALLNFVTRYLYSKSYGKDYEDRIVNHLDEIKGLIEQRMGTISTKAILKCGKSDLDKNLRVAAHQNFQEDHFIILNCMNWTLATQHIKTPINELFFNKGKLRTSQQIAAKINSSYLPCGPENPYVTIAKTVYNDTYNSNIGVYVCSNACNYIYSHLNCGWPNQTRDCLMCGKKIGSGGGMLNRHDLARKEEGARRLNSTKLIDNGSFYISSLRNLEEFWEAQRCYIESQINKMRLKDKIIIQQRKVDPKTKNLVVERTTECNMKGYNLSDNHDRISVFTAKILNLITECNLYWLITLDYLQGPQLKLLFNESSKQHILQTQLNKINKYILDVKQSVGVDDKVYNWVFAIQEKIIDFSLKFEAEFEDYYNNKKKYSKNLEEKLKAKAKTLPNKQHKDLYEDIATQLDKGLILKQITDVINAKQINLQNQFCRQAYEELAEKIVEKYLFDEKLSIIEKYERKQGKPQFEFEPILTEAKIDYARFPDSKLFKVPREHLTSDGIFNKYELIIKQDYPVINYILTNFPDFNALNSFSFVVRFINKIMNKANQSIPRYNSNMISLKDFWKDKEQIESFLSHWKKLNKFLGPVQIECKIYGTMNDQVDENTPISSFILDHSSKENASGNIVLGIFHNFAVKHNQLMTNIKTFINQTPKYRNKQYFLDNVQANPQDSFKTFLLREEDLNKKIMEFSVLSVNYGESTFYHNFDLFQAFILQDMKGLSEIDKEETHYENLMYVGEAFGLDSPQKYSLSIENLRENFYDRLTPQQEQTLQQVIRKKNDDELFRLKGNLQVLIYLASQMIDSEKLKKGIQISEFIQSLNNNQLEKEIWRFQFSQSNFIMENLAPIYEYLEKETFKLTIKILPDKYKVQIPPEILKPLKQFLMSLQQEPAEEEVTIEKLYVAIIRLMSRCCLSGTFTAETKKIFENIGFKQDFWDIDFEIYTNLTDFNTEASNVQLTAQYICHLLQIIRSYV